MLPQSASNNVQKTLAKHFDCGNNSHTVYDIPFCEAKFPGNRFGRVACIKGESNMRISGTSKQLVRMTIRFFAALAAGLSTGMLVLAIGVIMRGAEVPRGGQGEVASVAQSAAGSATSNGQPEMAAVGVWREIVLSEQWVNPCARDSVIAEMILRNDGQDFTSSYRSNDAVLSKNVLTVRYSNVNAHTARANGCAEIWGEM